MIMNALDRCKQAGDRTYSLVRNKELVKSLGEEVDIVLVMNE